MVLKIFFTLLIVAFVCIGLIKNHDVFFQEEDPPMLYKALLVIPLVLSVFGAIASLFFFIWS